MVEVFVGDYIGENVGVFIGKGVGDFNTSKIVT